MAITKAPLKDLRRQIQNKSATARMKVLLDAVCNKCDAITTGAAGFLTADASGRAVIAASFFDEATVTAKFVAGAITGAILKAGCISADATGRALFAAGVIDSATATSIFAANAIPFSKLATSIAPQALSGAGSVDLTKPICLFTSTGAGNALTLANGTVAGQYVCVIHTVKGSSGTGVLTPTTSQHTSYTFTNVNDSVELIWTGATWALASVIGATVTG